MSSNVPAMAFGVNWPSYTERSKNVMWRAAELANKDEKSYIGTDHLLQALVELQEGPHRSVIAQRVCAKCGGTDISTTYHKDRWSPGCPSSYQSATVEHLHKHCRGCSFEWDIPPLDAKPGARS